METTVEKKKEWKCLCNLTLPYWAAKMDDGNLRCQECKRVWDKEGKLLEE